MRRLRYKAMLTSFTPGCFEHYPNLKPMDQSLTNLNKVHDWLHFYDQLHHRVVSTQEWELMAYTPYAIVPWHPHLASPANVERPVEYPKADYEVCGAGKKTPSS
jgi:chromosome transmission fidelity protein 18